MRWLRQLPLLGASAALIWLLADAQAVRQAVAEGLALCAHMVIPALFPFLVLTSLLVSLGFCQLLLRPCGAVMALYGLDGTAASALILGLLGGYPLGARTAAQLTEQRLITPEEGNRLLTFCNNANPIFFLSVLGSGVFGSLRIGLWLWLIHLTAALLTGLILGRQKPRHRRTPQASSIGTVRLADAVVSAVHSGAETMLRICAFVVLFYVLALPLRQFSGTSGTVLAGLLELFSAVPRLTPDCSGFLLAAGLSGWGGLSVLCQSIAVLGDSGLSPAACFGGKAVQGMLSLLLAALLCPYVLG